MRHVWTVMLVTPGGSSVIAAAVSLPAAQWFVSRRQGRVLEWQGSADGARWASEEVGGVSYVIDRVEVWT